MCTYFKHTFFSSLRAFGAIGIIGKTGRSENRHFKGLRNFVQTTAALQQSSSEEKSASSDVIRSWVKSVVAGPSGGGGKEDNQEEEFVKRPDKSKRQQEGVSVSASRLDTSLAGGGGERKATKDKYSQYRRRLTDNMWTAAPLDDKIIWVDCEMTSLDPVNGQLMEIGMVITGPNLDIIARQDSIVFHIEESVLQGMDSWCVKHHGESGLTDSCRKSTNTHEAVDEQLLAFVQKYTNAGECPIGGNSVGQDRIFIARQLPKLNSHLHYRNVDVSTIKELVRRWYPTVYADAPKKRYSHRVMDDIQDSIDELKYYRSAVFISPSSVDSKGAKRDASGEQKLSQGL